MLKMEYQCLDCPLTLFKSAIEEHENTFGHMVSRTGKLVEHVPSNLLIETLDELNANPPKTHEVFERIHKPVNPQKFYPNTYKLFNHIRRHMLCNLDLRQRGT